MQKASKARIVLAVGAAALGNGTDVAPALITRVWSDNEQAGTSMVNATVFPDNSTTPRVVSSATLHPDEEAARADLGEGMTALFWPPRV